MDATSAEPDAWSLTPSDCPPFPEAPKPATEVKQWVKYVRVTTVAVVSVMVIVTNILNIAAWIRVRRIAMATRVYLINLSVSDLLVGLIACGPSVYPAFFDSWPYGSAWCQVSGVVHGSSVTVSIWSISMISIDRYLAVTWPLKYATWISRGRCALIVFGLWACAVVTFLAPCMTKEHFVYYQFTSEFAMCGLYWEYAVFCAVTGLYIPILCGSILIFTAVKIVQALKASSKFHEASGVQASSRSDNQKALKVIVATSAIYFCLWGPYVVLVVSESLYPRLKAMTPDWLSFATLWMANANSGINVIVYSVSNASFRKHLERILCPCRQFPDDSQESMRENSVYKDNSIHLKVTQQRI